jgi:lipid-binding SYLF domain-containing protein
MRCQGFSVYAILLAFGFSSTAVAQDATPAVQRRQEIDISAQATLDALFKANANAKTLYDNAAGYAVFTATKAGFFVSGGGGTGVAVNKETGKRTYMRMGLGGIGLGIGAQRYGLVVMFETAAHVDRFAAGGWDSSATAEAAAAKEGVAARSSFMDGIAFFQVTDKGLMAQADVTGTKFWVIEDLN